MSNMTFSECQGFMIPGLKTGKGYWFWLLSWRENPTTSPYVNEVWVFHPDGRRVCYIDPQGETGFFRKYHDFDEVVGTPVDLTFKNGLITLAVKTAGLQVQIMTGLSFGLMIMNRFLPLDNPPCFQTETGKTVQIIMKKLEKVKNCKMVLNGEDLGGLVTRPEAVKVGESSSSARPVLAWCTMRLEN